MAGFAENFIAFGHGMAGTQTPAQRVQQQAELQTALLRAQFEEQQRQRRELVPQQTAAALASARAQGFDFGGLSQGEKLGLGVNLAQQMQGQIAPDTAGTRLAASITNPAVQEAAIQAQIADVQAKQLAQAQQRIANHAQFRGLGQDIGVIQDMRTIFDNVGSETLPTAARGAFEALRFRGLEAIRRTTEAGALQQAEIELFNSILPEGDAWTALGREEKYARLNQLEYWFTQKLENAILASGEPFSVSDYLGFGREFDDILGSVPPGTVSGAGAPRDMSGDGTVSPQPTIPGTSIPIPAFGPGGVMR